MTRRVAAVLLCTLGGCTDARPLPRSAERELRLLDGASEVRRIWLSGDPHVNTDLEEGYESLAAAIDGVPFDYDIVLSAGDLVGGQFPPTEDDWAEWVRQAEGDRHLRYTVQGNHDASWYGDPSLYDRFVDPLGLRSNLSGNEHQRKPCPVSGDWRRYAIDCGDVLVLMLADRNDAPQPVGRGTAEQAGAGGFPSGAVTRATYEWWAEKVRTNQHRDVLITVHHHVLRDTTTVSGFGEGCAYHGPSGGCDEAGYLAYTIESWEPFSFSVSTAESPGPFEVFLEDWEAEHGVPAIDLWVGGHSHVGSADEELFGKGIVEEVFGVTFVQVSALTRHHANHGLVSSRFLTLADDHMVLDLYHHLGDEVVRSDLLPYRN